MFTEAQKKAQAKYDKNNTRSILFKLNLTSDADILARLDEVDNKQGYVKELIRNDIRGKDQTVSIDSIRLLIRPVAKKYQIEKVYLFGSYARGDENAQSDIDLMIKGGNYDGYFGFVDVKEALGNAVGKEVDLVEYRAVEEDNSRSGKRFRDHVERDKVLIYECDK